MIGLYVIFFKIFIYNRFRPTGKVKKKLPFFLNFHILKNIQRTKKRLIQKVTISRRFSILIF